MAIHEVAPQRRRHVERSVSDPPRSKPPAGNRRSGLKDGLLGVTLLAGPANVIMQLARPGVGYGVMESRVESGRIDLHPIKRARTTFTYLAVATAGSDSQKAAYRRAVNRAHAQVRSTPDSPVSYNAFDPALQLWVAACLYKGGVDVYRTFIGELSEEDADRHYREAMTFGTTLQVPPEMWPGPGRRRRAGVPLRDRRGARHRLRFGDERRGQRQPEGLRARRCRRRGRPPPRASRRAGAAGGVRC